MNRVMLHEDDVDASGRVSLRDRRADHLLRVLGVARGSTVRVGLLNGPVGTATVVETHDSRVDIECRFGVTPPPPRVDLLLALPRPKVLRRLWAPLASMGVGHIMLTNAEKVERNYFDTHWLHPDTYVPLLVEGLAQSGDTHLPRVSVIRRLKPYLEDALDTDVPDSTRLVAHPRAERRISELDLGNAGRVLGAIGPEGGWSDYEIALLGRRGFLPATLGSRALRSDTACVAILAVLVSRLEAAKRDVTGSVPGSCGVCPR